jgi:hypothetical protein
MLHVVRTNFAMSFNLRPEEQLGAFYRSWLLPHRASTVIKESEI